MEDFFSCSIKTELEAKELKVESIENRIRRQVNQLVSTAETIFADFESKFLSTIKQIKDTVIQALSEPLQETHLDMNYILNLKQKLAKSYAEFIRAGLLDESLFYNYIAIYDKILTLINSSASSTEQQSPEDSPNRKNNISVDFKPLNNFFTNLQNISSDFSKSFSIKPNIPHIPKLNKKATVSPIKPKHKDSISIQKVPESFWQNNHKLDIVVPIKATNHVLNNGSLQTEPDKTYSPPRIRGGNSVLDPLQVKRIRSSRANSSVDILQGSIIEEKPIKRKSNNYPYDKEGNSFVKELVLKHRNQTKRPLSFKYSYRLDNLKFFDSGHKGIVAVALYVEHLNVIITGGSEGTIKIWDISTLLCIRTFDTNHTQILALKYIPHKNLLAVTCRDSIVRVFSLNKSEYQMWTLLGHRSSVLSIECCLNVNNLVTGGSHTDKTIKVWNLDEKALEFEWKDDNWGASCLLYIDNLFRLIVGGGNGVICVYDMIKKTLKETIDTKSEGSGNNKEIVTLTYEEEKNLLYSANANGTVNIWNIAKYPTMNIRRFSYDLKHARLLILPKKGIAILTNRDQTIRIIDMATSDTLCMHEYLDEKGSAITMVGDSQVLVTDMVSSAIKIWTLSRFKSFSQNTLALTSRERRGSSQEMNP